MNLLNYSDFNSFKDDFDTINVGRKLKIVEGGWVGGWGLYPPPFASGYDAYEYKK